MENKPINRVTLLNITIFVEAFLLLLATLWSHFAGVPLIEHMKPDVRIILLGGAVGLVMAGFGYFLFRLGNKFNLFGQFKDIIYNYLLPLVADLRWPDLLVLAAVSGFCEEIFFRGVVQAQLGASNPAFGIAVTSLAFGFFHDPSCKHISYCLVAFIYGLVLGTLYHVTGNLWLPIVAHIVHNFVSLYILRYMIKPPAVPTA